MPPLVHTFEQVLERFRTIPIPEEFDLVVAVANGGLVPAGILAQRLSGENGKPIEVRLLRINFRDEHQRPRYEDPRLLSPLDFDPTGRRILLVDDRIKTGSTVRLARELLQGAAVVRSFAVNGTADYALFNETCFRFPWIM